MHWSIKLFYILQLSLDLDLFRLSFMHLGTSGNWTKNHVPHNIIADGGLLADSLWSSCLDNPLTYLPPCDMSVRGVLALIANLEVETSWWLLRIISGYLSLCCLKSQNVTIFMFSGHHVAISLFLCGCPFASKCREMQVCVVHLSIYKVS